ncbi:unnamed protein product [Notodromas monacha]|uniref:1-phosphatidylinositol-5-phosphate 4-kinase n=1 Tax=Notodromas monacha TaxID=399045 RepID=A0A7R9BD92_9CRUS|nr:unnamed protein product [Notodromas monacha]CAG0912628.1 unnamed protein product [Notodromas monacha]
MSPAIGAASFKMKKKHIRVKHQKRKLFRANEPLLSVFMWGVNHSINELSHVNIPVMLMPDDFKAYAKIKVDNHLFNKENMPSHFKVKEYCPLVFRNLRERFGMDDVDYRESLTVCQPVAVDSPGRSGAKFYLSHDQLFVIKTLTTEEVEQMHVLLKPYHQYVVERHGKTLLPQYMGMYRLTVESIEHYMVVMRNVFSANFKIHTKYDLKGSTVDREASEKEKGKDLPTLKDNDFVKDGVKILIGPDAKDKLLETLNADTAFLTKVHVMDYSLLLGIHDCERAEQEDREDMERQALEGDDEGEESSGSGGAGPRSIGGGDANPVPTPPDSPLNFTRPRALSNGQIDPQTDLYAIPSVEGGEPEYIYFMAIIDVLTHYGVKKQAAKAAKTVKYGEKAEGISTVEPEQYAKRFIDFLSKAIE